MGRAHTNPGPQARGAGSRPLGPPPGGPPDRRSPLEKVPPLRSRADEAVEADPEIAVMDDDALLAGIERLRRARGAVVLAHNYQLPAIQDLADAVGDSLELARWAARSPSELVVLCGVRLMAETAAILCPDKVVLSPDPEAGCSLSESVTAEQVRAWRQVHENGVVVAYVNTDATVKAEADACCTSANAVEVVAAMPPGRPILFVPDRFLGTVVAARTGRDVERWPGECHVHASIGLDDLERGIAAHPGAHVLVHPECGCVPEVLEANGPAGATGALVLGTGGMVRHAATCSASADVVATEVAMVHRLEKEHPAGRFVAAREDAICSYMKLVTLPKLYRALRDRVVPIEVPEPVATRAREAIEAMLAVG